VNALRGPSLCLVWLACLAGCVSIDHTTQVTVSSDDTRTFVDIAVPNKDLSFNWHGGGWWNGLDRYRLTIPRHRDAVFGNEIALETGIGASARIEPLGPASTVKLVGKTGCTIEIGLVDPGGKPLKVNGIYRSEPSGPYATSCSGARRSAARFSQ
jgi:hypothetical protein